MPDATAAQPSLLERMNARYEKLRSRDATIRKFQREVQKRTDEIRVAHQLRKVAKVAIREHEKWLKEEAAELIRREAGVKTIPGFASRRESAREFRRNLHERVKSANQAARSALNSSGP